MRLTITFLFFSLFASQDVWAQRFLQLERVHSPKSIKYFPGDEITFQLDQGQWHTRVIEDISWEQNLLIFANGHVVVDSITALRSFKNRRWSKPIGNQLVGFAFVWAVYSLIDGAVAGDVSSNFQGVGLGIPIAAVASGLSIKRLFRQRTFHFTKNKKGEAKKWRLRALDLEVVPSKTGGR